MEMTAAGATGPEFLTSHCMRRKGSVRTGTAFGRPGLISTESQSFQNQCPLPSAPCFQSPQPIPSDSPMYTRAHRHTQQRCHPASRGLPAVAGKALTIKQKSTLPVSKTRQDKSLFRSLSDTCPPPLEQTRCVVLIGRGSIGLLSNNARRQLMSIGASEHRAFVRAKARFAGPKAQGHSFIRRNAVFTGHIAMCRWRHFRQSRS